MAHSRAARKLRRELDAELKANGVAAGSELEWTAADRVTLERIACTVDRIGDLTRDYDAVGDDVKLRRQLAGEIRLQDAQLSRMLKLVKTEAPPPEPSLTSEGVQGCPSALGPREECQRVAGIGGRPSMRCACRACTHGFAGCLRPRAEKGDPRLLDVTDPKLKAALNGDVATDRARPADGSRMDRREPVMAIHGGWTGSLASRVSTRRG